MATKGYVTSTEAVCLLYINPQCVSVLTFMCVTCRQQGGVSHAQNVTLAYRKCVCVLLFFLGQNAS